MHKQNNSSGTRRNLVAAIAGTALAVPAFATPAGADYSTAITAALDYLGPTILNTAGPVLLILAIPLGLRLVMKMVKGAAK